MPRHGSPPASRKTLLLALVLLLPLSAIASSGPQTISPTNTAAVPARPGLPLTAGNERLAQIPSGDVGIRPAYDACMARNAGRTFDQADCAEAELSYQDARLNKAYAALLKRLSGRDKQVTVRAQRLWIEYSRLDCSSRSHRYGGIGGLADGPACRMESTAYRAQQLEDWLATLAVLDGPGFSGHWRYMQTCGYRHSADLYLKQQGDVVAGYWAEGTRLRGEFGALRGRVEQEHLSVAYCQGDTARGYTPCPTYDPAFRDRFVLRGDTLVRYRGTGEGTARHVEKDLTFHRVVPGKPAITDDHCPDRN